MNNINPGDCVRINFDQGAAPKGAIVKVTKVSDFHVNYEWDDEDYWLATLDSIEKVNPSEGVNADADSETT